VGPTGDVAKYTVVRIADEIVVGLMKSASGIDYKEASKEVVIRRIGEVEIPFASPRLLWRMKKNTHRERDAGDLLFLRKWFEARGESPSGNVFILGTPPSSSELTLRRSRCGTTGSGAIDAATGPTFSRGFIEGCESVDDSSGLRPSTSPLLLRLRGGGCGRKGWRRSRRRHDDSWRELPFAWFHERLRELAGSG
jgi:hypothetical protein